MILDTGSGARAPEPVMTQGAMMIELFPASHTVMHASFLSTVAKVLGRSAASETDRAGMAPADLASYISILGEFHEQSSNPVKTQREAGSILLHVSVSLLAISSREGLYEIATETPLSLLTAELGSGHPYAAAIVSGTLEQWRTVVIDGCSQSATAGLRMFASRSLACLERMGLARVFELYSKRIASDGTTFLTHKG